MIPVYLFSSDGVTNLVFDLPVSETSLTNWTITAVGSQIASATIQDQATNLLISLKTLPNQVLQGAQQVSWLNFTAATNQPSAIIRLTAANLASIKPGATPYSYAVIHPGSVTMVQNQPLLRALGGNELIQGLGLYGQLGTNYELQYSTNLGLPNSWHPLLDYTQTNQVINLNVGKTNSAIFYRLMRQ